MRHYKKLWKFANEAYTGTGGFANGDYIVQYPRENDEKIKRRKEIAYYINIFASKVHRYTGYLFRNAPVRSIGNDLLALMLDDVDRRGNSIDVFMSSFASAAKVRGAGLVLVDMPTEIPPSLAEQKAQRAVPYVVMIEPERLDDFRVDAFGRITHASFFDTIPDPEDPAKMIDIIRYYDETKWEVRDGEDVLESGEHGLGVCPVLGFGESGNFPDTGEFTQIAQIAKRHYNLKSELDEMLRSQTFSLLTFQGDPGKKGDGITISTDNALAYPKDANMPEFIAPPSAPADTYQKEIKDLEKTIDRIAYDTTASEGAESGISLQIKFQGLNGSLSNFAMRLEDLEYRIFDVAAKYLQLQSVDISISYPREFHILDTEKELATLQALKDLGYSMPTYESTKLKQIVQNDLGGVGYELIDEIVGEIEDGLKGIDE